MSEILTNNQYYSDIADTIRQMKGVATTYKPREMAGALRDMYSTEVEGAPPLTFPSNGNNLLNYRIDGANGGVGDRTANLLDYNWLFDYEQKRVNEYFNYIQITLEPNTTYNVTSDYDYNQAQNATAFIVVNSNTAITTANGGVFGSLTVTTTQDGILKIARRIKGNNETMVPKREDFENNSKHIQISINSVNGENYEPYGKYKIPAIISGKNLLKPDGAPTTIRGVSWSYREDGAIVGTRVSSNENVSDFTLMSSSTFQPGSYIYSCFDNESTPGASKYQSNISINGASYWGTGNYSFVLNEVSTIRVVLRVYPNFTGTAIFKPMIRLSSIQESNYEPFTEPTTTNIYLDKPIGANESKSLSDTNVNIPTINGTNILSIGTTVQPSNVYVQAPKTNNYNL